MIHEPFTHEEMLTLAAEPVTMAITHAEQYSDALAMVEDAAQQAMIAQVQRDTEALADITAQYLKRTPHPSASDLYAMDSWSEAFLANGNERAIKLLKEAAQMGWNLGRQHLRTDSATLGFGSPSIPEDVPLTNWLQAATDRITDAYNEWRGRIQLAIHNAISQVDLSPAARAEFFNELADPINANLVLRNSLAATTTVQRSHTDALTMGAFEIGDAIKLVWITHFTKNTCGMCAALHGTTVSPGGEFDATATRTGKLVPVFTDLDGPPRHPNCACVLSVILNDAPHLPAVDYSGEPAGLIDRLVALFNKLRGNVK